ncbi:hypothetical protein [Maribacter sp. 2307ULW6-5]
MDDMLEKASEMIALYQNWADEINVLPWDEVLEIREKRRQKNP